jgi:ABC-2 type transport system ATP-binding protein
VLEELELVVERGETVGIVGANGSGKSTLLRVVAGLVQPRDGTVFVLGRPCADAARDHQMGAAIDTPALYSWMSGRAVLRTLLDLSGTVDRGRSAEVMRRFGLDPDSRRVVARYSQGMRKRLALAAASLHAPALLLLDEPTNALDDSGRELVLAWLHEQRELGTSIILASHRDGDLRGCDRVLVLQSGRLVDGPQRGDTPR